MLNSISRACIQQAVHAGSLYVYTTISVVPTETVIVNRDREQRPFANFVQLAQEFKREEEGRKNIGVRLANFTGN